MAQEPSLGESGPPCARRLSALRIQYIIEYGAERHLAAKSARKEVPLSPRDSPGHSPGQQDTLKRVVPGACTRAGRVYPGWCRGGIYQVVGWHIPGYTSLYASLVGIPGYTSLYASLVGISGYIPPYIHPGGYTRVYTTLCTSCLPGYTLPYTLLPAASWPGHGGPGPVGGPCTEPWAQTRRNPWVGRLSASREAESVSLPMGSARGSSALPRADRIKIG